MEYDRERRLFLEHFGINVIRFENKRVFEDEEWVLDNIRYWFGWRELWRVGYDQVGFLGGAQRTTPPATAGPLLRKEGSLVCVKKIRPLTKIHKRCTTKAPLLTKEGWHAFFA
jgi:hypothetical protein